LDRRHGDRYRLDVNLYRACGSMTKIVDLQSYRVKAVEQRGFGPWKKRFGESFDAHTGVADLSDQTLYFLAQPGESSSVAYYEVIMGILNLGSATKFHYLGNQEQMLVVDLHLFLADQVRFEMMRRLGWIRDFEGHKYGIIELVQKFEELKDSFRLNPPVLAESQPDFAEYSRLTAGDKEVFIRRMLNQALDTFKKRL
jgi:hypothetical protein